jgi:hypothetical protein
MRLSGDDNVRGEHTPVVPWVAAGCVTLAALATFVLWQAAYSGTAAPVPTAAEPTTTATVLPTSTVSLIPAVTVTQPATTTTVMPPEKDHVAPNAAGQVEVAVEGFVSGWLTPGDPEARTAALAPFASPQLVGALAPVPADNLPEATLVSVEVGPVSELQATATVELSNGWRVTVDVVSTAGGWRVRDYERTA